MDITIFVFLTSGIFLGWSFGANHLGNVFGTAVGTRMLSLFTAGVIFSVFVVLGSVISGAGPAQTLGKLGAVNALAGAFMTALSSGLTMFMMTRAGLPVSSTQAIIGGIVGWNLFSATVTDTVALTEIMVSWLAGPLLASVIAMGLYALVKRFLQRTRIHLLRVDAYNRVGLIVAGAFGAYSLGANNIANVMGVFVNAVPFTDIQILGFELSGAQQLFLIGSIAIAVGALTFSRKVVHTVGSELLQMSPAAAWVVVMSHSIVLLVFASRDLQGFLMKLGLPTIPLVPISSSEVAVGAVLGIALLQGGSGMRWGALGRIGVGWVITPVMTAFVCFFGLFFLQNTFQQQVYREVRYELSPLVLQKLDAAAGISTAQVGDLAGHVFHSSTPFIRALGERVHLSKSSEKKALEYAETAHYTIAPAKVARIKGGLLSPEQKEALRRLSGMAFIHKWQIAEALAAQSDEWRLREDTVANESYNKELRAKLSVIYRIFADA